MDLDPKTYSDLDRHLLEFEGRLQTPRSKSIRARDMATPHNPDLDRQIGPAAIGMRSDFPAASSRDHLTPPMRPFLVHASESCPAGTERHESKQAHHDLEWCQQLAADGGLRHGWYAKYLEDGQPESMGQYESGLRVGVWTRFYSTGEVRAQAEFVKGMQHGWVLAFDKTGEPTRSARYEYGTRITAE
jgi:hypothetical protein